MMFLFPGKLCVATLSLSLTSNDIWDWCLLGEAWVENVFCFPIMLVPTEGEVSAEDTSSITINVGAHTASALLGVRHCSQTRHEHFDGCPPAHRIASGTEGQWQFLFPAGLFEENAYSSLRLSCIFLASFHRNMPSAPSRGSIPGSLNLAHSRHNKTGLRFGFLRAEAQTGIPAIFNE